MAPIINKSFFKIASNSLEVLKSFKYLLCLYKFYEKNNLSSDSCIMLANS